MNILLIDNETKLLQKLEDMIPGHEIVHKWNDLENINSEDFDLIVLSGGSKFNILGNEDKLKDEIRIIKDCKKPLLGICYGCELIIDALGGTIKELPEFKTGIIEIKILKDDEIFGDIKSFNAYEHHQWCVDKLPPNFVPLAESIHSYEVVRHESLPIYGFQFHPEQLIDKNDGYKIFMNFFNKYVV